MTSIYDVLMIFFVQEAEKSDFTTFETELY